MGKFRGLSSKFRDKEEFYFYDKVVPANPGFPSPTPTMTQTPTNTPTNTQTPTNTPTASQTPTLTPFLSASQTPTQTQTPTKTPTQTPTVTPGLSPSQTPSHTPTNTVTPTHTPTQTPTPSPPPDDSYQYYIDTTIQTSGSVSGTTTATNQYRLPSIMTVSDSSSGYLEYDFGDGLGFQTGMANPYTYSTPGTYLIKIRALTPGAKITRIQHFDTTGDSSKVTEIVKWGNSGCDYTNWEGHLRKCHSLTTLPTYQPDFPVGSSLKQWFGTMTAFNDDITWWDVSNVISLEGTFRSLQNVNAAFNQNISVWDVSNVTNFYETFYGTGLFNQNIGSWDVSSATTMAGMFSSELTSNPNTFNNGGSPSISGWTTTNVTSMNNMFSNNSVFNQPIGSWDVSNVTDMAVMFRKNTGFNQPIGSWNTSSVTNMDSMFRQNTIFNQPIGSWNVANVTDMEAMFRDNTAFDQNIGAWTFTSLTTMNYMFDSSIFNNGGSPDINNWDITPLAPGGTFLGIFRNSTGFNQPVGNWNVSSFTQLLNIFEGATAFDQSLGNWDISSITTGGAGSLNGLLKNCGMSTANYDATLIGWDFPPAPPSSLTLDADGLTYTLGGAAESARNYLTITRSWTINGDTGV